MTEEELIKALSSHPFLSGFSLGHLKELASGAKTFHASPGQLLGKEGEPAARFYMIQEGQVELLVDVPGKGLVPIQTVGPGDVVGWSWLVPPHQWRFDCRAAQEVTGLEFDGLWLRNKCEQDHELGYQFLRQLVAVIAGRLTATRVQLLDIYK